MSRRYFGLIFASCVMFGLIFSSANDVSARSTSVNVTDYRAIAVKNNWWSFTNDNTNKKYVRVKKDTQLVVTWVVNNSHGKFYRVYSPNYKKSFGLLDARAVSPVSVKQSPTNKSVIKNNYWTFSNLNTTTRFKQVKYGQQARITAKLTNDTGTYYRITINGSDFGWLIARALGKADLAYPHTAKYLSTIGYNESYFTGQTTPESKVSFGRWINGKFISNGSDVYANDNGYFTFKLQTKVLPNTQYVIYCKKMNNGLSVRSYVTTNHAVLALGDSITYAGEAGADSYVRTAARNLGYDIYVAARNGGQITGLATNSLTAQINRVTLGNMKYFDKISIGLGTNDWRYSTDSLGSLESVLRARVLSIKQANPKAQIYGVLPSPRYVTASDSQLATSKLGAGKYSHDNLVSGIQTVYS